MKKTIFWFYRCIHCGQWYYTDKRIKQKKCVICNKTFSFEESKKKKIQCTPKEAIEYVKYLKALGYIERANKEKDKEIKDAEIRS